MFLRVASERRVRPGNFWKARASARRQCTAPPERGEDTRKSTASRWKAARLPHFCPAQFSGDWGLDTHKGSSWLILDPVPGHSWESLGPLGGGAERDEVW